MAIGSSLSVRGFVRMGSQVSFKSGSLHMGAEKLNFFNDDTYIVGASGPAMEFYAGSGGSPVKAMTISDTGGDLHGNWNAEVALSTSDRRYKKDIVSLQRTLRQAIVKKADEKQVVAAPATDPSGGGDGALWMLRQMRPVSYSFKAGAESKFMRFGFVADELESVVPNVVRTVPTKDVSDKKAVVYQDLIALLTAASQSQQTVIEAMTSRMDRMERMLSDTLSKLVAAQEDPQPAMDEFMNATNATNTSVSSNESSVEHTAVQPPVDPLVV